MSAKILNENLKKYQDLENNTKNDLNDKIDDEYNHHQNFDTIKRSLSSKDLSLLCAHLAIDKKGENNIIFDLTKTSSFTDFFVITSTQSEKQSQAIADEILLMCKELGLKKPTLEGYEEGRWVLVDFGDVVVHIFHTDIREFYRLDELWYDHPRVRIPNDFFTTKTDYKTYKA
jgi:ribosome-associated protein